MEVKLKYRGRTVTAADVTFIRALIAANPTASRRALSQLLCRAWHWYQPNGAPRDMVCRGLMLALHRGEHITLPAKRRFPLNPLAQRQKPSGDHSIEQTPLHCRLGDLPALEFSQVRRSAGERLFNSLIEAHHYLGYTQPVGEQLKYLIHAGDRPVACMAWSSAPRHIGCRDRFIGWPAETRRRNLHLLAYNSRFLILPWVSVRHLASHILGRMARVLPLDWQRIYNHPVHFLETFVDTERFAGTCYRAANWLYLGKTTGRGKADNTGKPNRSIKDVLGYPLSKRFRELLSEDLE